MESMTSSTDSCHPVGLLHGCPSPHAHFAHAHPKKAREAAAGKQHHGWRNNRFKRDTFYVISRFKARGREVSDTIVHDVTGASSAIRFMDCTKKDERCYKECASLVYVYSGRDQILYAIGGAGTLNEARLRHN